VAAHRTGRRDQDLCWRCREIHRYYAGYTGDRTRLRSPLQPALDRCHWPRKRGRSAQHGKEAFGACDDRIPSYELLCLTISRRGGSKAAPACRMHASPTARIGSIITRAVAEAPNQLTIMVTAIRLGHQFFADHGNQVDPVAYSDANAAQASPSILWLGQAKEHPGVACG
jgi:hypothetical protein